MRYLLKAIALAGLAGAALAVPMHAQAACGPLNGTYGVLVNGANLTTGYLKYLTGYLTFTNCNVSGSVFYGSEGAVSGNWTTPSGTAVANSNGTITLSLNVPGITGTQVYSVAYSSAAMEAVGIEVDGLLNGGASPVTASIDLQAQVIQTTVTSTATTTPTCAVPLLCILNPPKATTTTTTTAAPALTYGNSTLKGTWAASCFSPQGSTDVNVINFDGNGNISSTSEDTFNNGGNGGASLYSGNYIVASDGRLFGSANVGGNIFTFAGVVDNQQTEIQYFYFNSTGAVTGCTGKKV